MTVIADTIDEFASDPEMVAMFVSNATRLLEKIETDLNALETVAPADRITIVNRIFRAVHTIKGESGFVALDTIGTLTHTMENLLDQLRDSKAPSVSRVAAALLSSVGVLRSLIENVDESNHTDISETLTHLDQIGQDAGTAPLAVAVPKHATRRLATEVLASAAAVPLVVVPPKPKSSQPQTRTRVLVVDDEPIVRSLVSRQFSKLGIAIDQADSAETAQRMMRKSLYHVVICDLNLPGISGVELLPKLKAISPLVQVIMLTGDANLMTVLESLENGAIDFIPKTRDYSLLVQPVCDALARVDRWTPLMRSRR